MLVTSH